MTPEAAKATLEQALIKFVKVARMPAEVRRGWCIEAMRDLYRRLVETGDYSGAIKAVKEMANLAGVDAKKAPPAAGDPARV